MSKSYQIKADIAIENQTLQDSMVAKAVLLDKILNQPDLQKIFFGFGRINIYAQLIDHNSGKACDLLKYLLSLAKADHNGKVCLFKSVFDEQGEPHYAIAMPAEMIARNLRMCKSTIDHCLNVLKYSGLIDWKIEPWQEDNKFVKRRFIWIKVDAFIQKILEIIKLDPFIFLGKDNEDDAHNNKLLNRVTGFISKIYQSLESLSYTDLLSKIKSTTVEKATEPEPKKEPEIMEVPSNLKPEPKKDYPVHKPKGDRYFNGEQKVDWYRNRAEKAINKCRLDDAQLKECKEYLVKLFQADNGQLTLTEAMQKTEIQFWEERKSGSNLFVTHWLASQATREEYLMQAKRDRPLESIKKEYYANPLIREALIALLEMGELVNDRLDKLMADDRSIQISFNEHHEIWKKPIEELEAIVIRYQQWMFSRN